jgi:osmotically inducible protein OsmC
MKRKASARWQGSLRAGSGIVSTASGTLRSVPYGFATRFENARGTNPEELIAAAHASCFAMAVAAALSNAGHAVRSISASATVSMEKSDDQWTVQSSDLSVEVDASGIGEEKFQLLAEEAKANCPISRLLKARITLQARLRAMDAQIPPLVESNQGGPTP